MAAGEVVSRGSPAAPSFSAVSGPPNRRGRQWNCGKAADSTNGKRKQQAEHDLHVGVPPVFSRERAPGPPRAGAR